MAKFCTSCGSSLNDSDRFCANCGKEFIKEVDPPQTKNVQEKTPRKRQPLSYPEKIFLVTVVAFIIIVAFVETISSRQSNSSESEVNKTYQTYTDTSKNLDGYKSLPDSLKINADTEPTEPTADSTFNYSNINQTQKNNSGLIVNGFDVNKDFKKFHATIDENKKYCKWCNKVEVSCNVMTDDDVNKLELHEKIKNVLIDYYDWASENKVDESPNDWNKILVNYGIDSVNYNELYFKIRNSSLKDWINKNTNPLQMIFGKNKEKSKEIIIHRYYNCQEFCSLKCQNEYEEKYGKIY